MHKEVKQIFLFFSFLFFSKTFSKGFGRLCEAILINNLNEGQENCPKVAIKERIRDDIKNQENWKKEIEILQRIEKEIPKLVTPRMICSLDDSSRNIPKKYIVMEWVEGSDFTRLRTSFEIIKDDHEKLKEFLRMMMIVLNELKKMHLCNFTHRDIKLDNLMFTKTNKDEKPNYMIIDFGSSFNQNDDKSLRIPTSSPGYSPPEQNTQNESYRSDIFALGVCFAKLLNIISLSNKNKKIKELTPQPIIEMIDKMQEKQIEKRISLDQCIQIVSQSFVECLQLNSIEENFFDQPFLSDIEILRKQINESKEINLKIFTQLNKFTSILKNLVNSPLNQIKASSFPNEQNSKEILIEQNSKEISIEEKSDLPNITQFFSSTSFFSCSSSATFPPLIKPNTNMEIQNSIENNDLSSLNFLLKKKSQVNHQDPNGDSALHFACKNKVNLDILKCLIDHKANMNLQNKNLQTPLHFACSNKNNLEAIKVLVVNGGNPNLKDKDGLIPKQIAKKHLKKEKILLKEIDYILKNYKNNN